MITQRGRSEKKIGDIPPRELRKYCCICNGAAVLVGKSCLQFVIFQSSGKRGAAGVWGLALLAGAPGHLRSGLGCRVAERSRVPIRSGRLTWCAPLFDYSLGPAGGRSFQQASGRLAVGHDLLRSAARVGAGSQERRADMSVSVFDGLADGEAQLGELLYSGERLRRSLPLLFFFF
ncbi:hypothetical protein NDU88_001824 [Pleurodeles waltl]|uniref:Uncharacterized protein n=1 Tax=Pleurodeles waltl TaxID=8319 RepID=A0AAV7P8A7_PLEWA|nr:hypothetical protein NDU88_001824 [Pleurodeles waltl]